MAEPRKRGRPSLNPARGRQGGRIAYRVDVALLEAAEAMAAREHLTLGAYARAALARHITLTATKEIRRRFVDSE